MKVPVMGTKQDGIFIKTVKGMNSIQIKDKINDFLKKTTYNVQVKVDMYKRGYIVNGTKRVMLDLDGNEVVKGKFSTDELERIRLLLNS